MKNRDYIMDNTGRGFFTEFTWSKFLLYLVAALYVVAAGAVSILEPFFDLPCDDPGKDLEFPNPAYDGTRCPQIRYQMLLGLTREECGFTRRLVSSCLLGGLIGWERRQADR